MKDIDWSKAPEGATHGRYVENLTPDFYRVHEGSLQFWWLHSVWKLCPWRTINDASMVARPSATQWTGPADGLPPVGIDCEFCRIDDLQKESLEDGALVTIIAHYKNQQGIDVAAFTYDVNDIRDVESAIAKCFRPIRTPEQLAAEAREKAIDELVRRFGINGSMVNQYGLFARMYDAGVFNVKE